MKKISKSALYVALGLTASISLTATITAVKLSKPFKPSFYNYKSYMSDLNQQVLRKEFNYKSFDEINQFTNALINRKAAGGIGSDFLGASLISKGLLKKIDYSVLFNDPSLHKLSYSKQKQITKKALQILIRKEIWEHLDSYNKYLVDANNERILDEDGTPVEFWQYFLPYYSQDSVVSFNLLKQDMNNANAVLKALSKPSKTLEDYSLEDFPEIANKVATLKNIDFFSTENDLYPGTEGPTDLVNILLKLREHNYQNWTITDAIRDNMLFGSSYWKKADGTRTASDFTGEVEVKTYKELIDAFVDLVKDGTGYAVTNSNHISFKGDGLELLNNLVNLTRPDVTAAIMYNGDAIDGYYGADNLPGWAIDGSIASIKPKHNVLLVDGLVFSANNTDEKNNKYLQVIAESIYSNIKNEYQIIKDSLFSETTDEFLTQVSQNLIEEQITNHWKEFKENELVSAFDTKIQKEPSFKNEITNFINKYANILNLNNPQNQEFKNYYYQNRIKIINPNQELLFEYFNNQGKELIEHIRNKTNDLDSSSEYLILKTLVDNFLEENPEYFEENEDNLESWANLVSQLVGYLDLENEDTLSKFLDLDNFNYINYVPTQNVDYELVLRNYFATAGYGIDETAVKIYRIENSKDVIHKGIAPIDDQLQSLITTYYFNKTKS
ncbi:hypothetical protein [Mycoplasma hafezii]|uniref:hypothetical protein n=1 Tax=Mycoplasma hafezii TaxID=525886 RepID=UPI003CED98DE